MQVPTLIIHAEDDEMCPFSGGELLYKNSNQLIEPLFVEKGGHLDILEHNSDLYYPTINKFLGHVKERNANFKGDIDKWRDESQGTLFKNYPHVFREAFNSDLELPNGDTDRSEQFSLIKKRDY